MTFLDASAAAKQYSQERGSQRVQGLFEEPSPLCSLVILRCELTSVLNRKRRERFISAREHSAATKQVGEDLSRMRLVPVDDTLIVTSLRLLDRHPLKTLDSLYLAGALNLRPSVTVLFVSSDRQLLRAARAEGLDTLDSERA